MSWEVALEATQQIDMDDEIFVEYGPDYVDNMNKRVPCSCSLSFGTGPYRCSGFIAASADLVKKVNEFLPLPLQTIRQQYNNNVPGPQHNDELERLTSELAKQREELMSLKRSRTDEHDRLQNNSMIWQPNTTISPSKTRPMRIMSH